MFLSLMHFIFYILASLKKCFLALFLVVIFCVTVLFLEVLVEAARLGEASLADVARVGLLPCMDRHVLFEGRVAGELFSAVGTEDHAVGSVAPNRHPGHLEIGNKR